jgi:hypothetical protein
MLLVMLNWVIEASVMLNSIEGRVIDAMKPKKIRPMSTRKPRKPSCAAFSAD